MSYTIEEVISALPRPLSKQLPAPSYSPREHRVGIGLGTHLALAVASMKDHTTDEGWQIMQGLEHAGYDLWGHGLPLGETRVNRILSHSRAEVVVLQDKREWDLRPNDFRDPQAAFTNVESLCQRNDVFKLTILKDAQARPEYHRASANEIGCHAWIVYYHRAIVAHLCPYVRPEHLIRTFHTLDPQVVPPYSAAGRRGCILTGAISGAYPLRTRLAQEAANLEIEVYPHPGYHRNGCHTPDYLKLLSQYKVAICTASRYGYALRKIIEATAAGCMVITDLPEDDWLPGIDDNLFRVRPDIPSRFIHNLIQTCLCHYDPARQRYYAHEAIAYYDWREEGKRLASSIERLRENYP